MLIICQLSWNTISVSRWVRLPEYMFVVNLDTLAGEIRIERKKVVFLCWMQDWNPGSGTPNRQQTECLLTNRLSYRGSSLKLELDSPSKVHTLSNGKMIFGMLPLYNLYVDHYTTNSKNGKRPGTFAIENMYWNIQLGTDSRRTPEDVVM